MHADEIRELSDSEIRGRIAELEEERFRLRFRSATEALDEPLRFRAIRKDVARLKTVLRERELGVRGAEPRIEPAAAQRAASAKRASPKPGPEKRGTTKRAASKRGAGKKAAAKRASGKRAAGKRSGEKSGGARRTKR